jgi:lysophospholipase L1-like esterase
MSPPRPGFGSKALALAVSALAALALGEAWLRLARPERLATIEYPCFYEPDPELGFRYQPNAAGRVAGHFEIENLARTNSLGFYDEEPLPPGEALPRILAVGDSFTAAMNVPRSEVWTAVLERRLRAAGWPQADVVNLGLDGTGSDVHAALIERELPRFRPDVVLLAFFGNDFADVLNGRFTRECHRGWVLSYQSEAQRSDLRARVDAHLTRTTHRFLYEHLQLVGLLTLALEGPRSLHHIRYVQPSAAELGIDDAARSRREPALTRALDALESIARSCNCRFVVTPVPAKAGLAGSLEVFRARTGERSFEIFDVAPLIESRLDERGLEPADLFFVNDAHLDALGNELFADAVFELLAPGLQPAN